MTLVLSFYTFPCIGRKRKCNTILINEIFCPTNFAINNKDFRCCWPVYFVLSKGSFSNDLGILSYYNDQNGWWRKKEKKDIAFSLLKPGAYITHNATRQRRADHADFAQLPPNPQKNKLIQMFGHVVIYIPH